VAQGVVTVKFKPVIKFVETETQTTVEFYPKDKTPGFTHRVVINGISKDWLGDNAKPNAKSAAFFFNKHCVATKTS